ncbi:hypothetical protein BDZ88DRAFT_410861 [Geranomyces variabilis]|nr:hypothetical protein BDZ88DRAFT_410861 [Geranomyces variabilis]
MNKMLSSLFFLRCCWLKARTCGITNWRLGEEKRNGTKGKRSTESKDPPHNKRISSRPSHSSSRSGSNLFHDNQPLSNSLILSA